MKNKRLLKFIYNGLVLTAAAIIMRTVSVSFNAYVTSRVGAEEPGSCLHCCWRGTAGSGAGSPSWCGIS